MTPRIYVACLAAYNNGKLHGKWIDADQDEDDIWSAIKEVLASSPEPGAEEWAVHDFECFAGVELGEYPSVSDVATIGHLIASDDDAELLIALTQHLSGKVTTETLASAKEYKDENYQGHFDKLEDWAYGFAEDTGANLGVYASYIDWERVAADAEMGGDIFSIDLDGKVHVFWNH